MSDEGPLGTFEEQVMLAVLRTDAEAFGMAVRRELEEVTGRDVAVGAVYATLDRLEAKGLVDSVRPRTDGPSRRLFRVTRPGLLALGETRAMERVAGILLRGMAALAALALWGVAWGWLEARSDPVVRRAALELADWPAGAAPVRVALLSDIHAGARSVPPERLARVVAQINAEKPDLILIAGDFTPGHDPIDAPTAWRMLAPLARLRAPLGVIAVPGNHDHWTGLAAVRAALANAGIRLLANQAVVRGPLVIGAVDDIHSKHADGPAAFAAARRLSGARLVLTHSPDIAPKLPADFALLLAGHTHCGQVVIPWRGSVSPVSRFGDRYRCGIIREGARTVVVTAGIGTSGPPLRFNARPDVWLLTLGPQGPVRR